MRKGRIEAFSDGVLAIIITIMVLELKPPQGATLESLCALSPVFLSYVLSFVYVGIYWNNHHHMFQAVHRVNGATLWANLHLLFWLSLVPFSTAWMGENHFAQLPVAVYGLILLMSGIAYSILYATLTSLHGENSTLVRAVGSDFKGKLSLVLYVVGTGLSFVNRWLALGVYVLVALMWFIPDPRIENAHRLDNQTSGEVE